MDHNKLQSILRDLHSSTRIQLAFVIDKDGGLLAWVGHSQAFSPTGQFASFEQDQERNENLDLTVLGNYYLGVLFQDGTPLDEIRQDIERHQDALRSCLDPNH